MLGKIYIRDSEWKNKYLHRVNGKINICIGMDLFVKRFIC